MPRSKMKYASDSIKQTKTNKHINEIQKINEFTENINGFTQKKLRTTNFKELIEFSQIKLDDFDKNNFNIKLFCKLIKEFFTFDNISNEEFRKKGLFWIEGFFGKKLLLGQKLEEINLAWDENKKEFLTKNSFFKKEDVFSEEIQEILKKMEEILAEEMKQNEVINEIVIGFRDFSIFNEGLGQIKQDSMNNLTGLLRILRNNSTEGQYSSKEDIRMLAKIQLYFLRNEFDKLERQSQSLLTTHKTFFVVVRESYEELILLIEILGKKIKILKSQLQFSENQINLILLPFTFAHSANFQVLGTSTNTLKKLEKKINSFKKKLKKVKINSSFFQILKHQERSEIKNQLRSLESEHFQVFSQVKLIHDFPRLELDLCGLDNLIFAFSKEEKPLSRDFDMEFFSKTSRIQLFLELLKQQPTPIKIITAFKDSLETKLSILFSSMEALKLRVKEKQREEFQKMGSLKQEAEDLSNKVQLFLEKNHLNAEEKSALKSDLKTLIEKFDTLSKWQDITEYALSQIYSMKTQMQKDLQNMSYFEEMINFVCSQITFPAMKSMLMGLRMGSKINLLKPFLRKIENYYISLIEVPSLFKPMKDLLARVKNLMPCLGHFQKTFEEFTEKFMSFSNDYETLKEEIWGLKDKFLTKIGNLCENKDDKAFFKTSAEDFMLSMKKHYENLTPENIHYLQNESKHILREIESRIDFFYSNKENLNNMAISYNLQVRLKNTIESFFRIINKLKLTYNSKTLQDKNPLFMETEEILHRCEGLVNSLLKISVVTSKIMEAFEQNKKNVDTKERFQLLKSFLHELRQEKVGLIQEKTIIQDEQIGSLYIFLLDDIAKLQRFFEKLVPDIEKYLNFKQFFQGNKKTSVKDQNFLMNLKNFLTFNKEINNNPVTHKLNLFQESSSINDLIQETYYFWYEEILKFFVGFDVEWLNKLYIILNILNKNPLKPLIEESEKFVSDYLEKKQKIKENNSKEHVELWLFFKERVYYFNEKYKNLQLSIFSLETLNKMEVLNNIFFEDLKLLKCEFEETPSFTGWADSFEWLAKVIEAGERVVPCASKATYIIWKKALAKLYLLRLEEYVETTDMIKTQENLVRGGIEIIKDYFFSIKKKIM